MPNFIRLREAPISRKNFILLLNRVHTKIFVHLDVYIYTQVYM